MIRRPALALLLALIPGLASAQFAVIAPTPPTADNGDRIATTAWVNSFFSGSLPLASGKIFIGSVGGVAVAQTPSADLAVSNAGAFTLATVNGNVGTFGSTTQCVTVTNNAKGLTTAIAAATCTPAIGSITGLGTGIATALGVNVGTAGSVVVNGGALGTPSSGTLTSATGLPISTGLTGAGTGVLTALGVNIGSAGAFTTFNGALGTPSSITLTNGTGLPTTSLTGALQAAQEPAHTGDMTNTAGSLATVVAKINGVDQTTAWTSVALTTGTITCNGGGTITTLTNAFYRWKQLGKTTWLQFRIQVGTLGSCIGPLSFALPANNNTTANLIPAAAHDNTAGAGFDAYATSNLLVLNTTAAVHDYYGSLTYEAN